MRDNVSPRSTNLSRVSSIWSRVWLTLDAVVDDDAAASLARYFARMSCAERLTGATSAFDDERKDDPANNSARSLDSSGCILPYGDRASSCTSANNSARSVVVYVGSSRRLCDASSFVGVTVASFSMATLARSRSMSILFLNGVPPAGDADVDDGVPTVDARFDVVSIAISQLFSSIAKRATRAASAAAATSSSMTRPAAGAESLGNVSKRAIVAPSSVMTTPVPSLAKAVRFAFDKAGTGPNGAPNGANDGNAYARSRPYDVRATTQHSSRLCPKSPPLTTSALTSGSSRRILRKVNRSPRAHPNAEYTRSAFTPMVATSAVRLGIDGAGTSDSSSSVDNTLSSSSTSSSTVNSAAKNEYAKSAGGVNQPADEDDEEEGEHASAGEPSSLSNAIDNAAVGDFGRMGVPIRVPVRNAWKRTPLSTSSTAKTSSSGCSGRGKPKPNAATPASACETSIFEFEDDNADDAGGGGALHATAPR
mmetsp:Transcript_7351/g.24680  ORF Transcript_7351/g.24680 Transcript_7351/m.24680 type:complete len:480 (+) Transcript_7351:132-1571(+)